MSSDAPVRRRRKKRVVNDARQREAYNLRQAGAAWHSIAEELEYPNEKQAFAAASAYAKSVEREEKTQLLGMQLDRLNFMLMALWPGIIEGRVAHVATGLQVMTAINRLNGIEDQTSVKVTVDAAHMPAQRVLIIGGSKDEYMKALQEAGGTAKSREMAGQKEVRELLEENNQIIDTKIVPQMERLPKKSRTEAAEVIGSYLQENELLHNPGEQALFRIEDD